MFIDYLGHTVNTLGCPPLPSNCQEWKQISPVLPTKQVMMLVVTITVFRGTTHKKSTCDYSPEHKHGTWIFDSAPLEKLPSLVPDIFAPENGGLEDESPFGFRPIFRGHVSFREGIFRNLENHHFQARCHHQTIFKHPLKTNKYLSANWCLVQMIHFL